MDSNPLTGLIGFWMMLQLVATIALLLGGIYVLFCIGRAAAGLDRMATAMEEWVARQNPPAPLHQPRTPPQAVAYQPPASTPATQDAPPPSPAIRPEYSPSDETIR